MSLPKVIAQGKRENKILGRLGPASRDSVRFGMARKGMVWLAWCGRYGEAWQVTLGHGKVWQA